MAGWRNNRCLQISIAELEKHNIPYKVDVTKKHTKLRFGPEFKRMIVTGSSTSDQKAWLNARTVVRRIIREMETPQ